VPYNRVPPEVPGDVLSSIADVMASRATDHAARQTAFLALATLAATEPPPPALGALVPQVLHRCVVPQVAGRTPLTLEALALLARLVVAFPGAVWAHWGAVFPGLGALLSCEDDGCRCGALEVVREVRAHTR
jgi:hypothetical protein